MNPLPKQQDFNKLSRLKRSIIGNLKLIDRLENNTYTVYGSTGKVYTIKTQPSMCCTCFDFTTRKSYCKHIYFILTNVYKIVPELGKIYTSAELQEFLNKEIVFTERNTECSICFEELHKNKQICKTCNYAFHSGCINSMIRISKKTNCPMCRCSMDSLGDIINKIKML